MKSQATVELSGRHSRGNMILEDRAYVMDSDHYAPNVNVVYALDEERAKEMIHEAFAYDFKAK